VLGAGVTAFRTLGADFPVAAKGITAGKIRQINRALGGTAELTGSAETVIANMAYREGAQAQAATAIRDIAGRHLFDDANGSDVLALLRDAIEFYKSEVWSRQS
jgi:hypothetical protein